MHRREFLGSIALPVGAAAWLATSGAHAALRPGAARLLASQPPEMPPNAGGENFWGGIARAFTIDRSVVNLNNGGVSPAPAMVQEAMKRHLDHANSVPPPVALWRELEPRKEGVRQRLAREWGVDPEEIAITRNASESLQICQFGFDLKAGDEVLTTTVDYPRMITTFKQRARREGIVLRQIKIPIPCEDEGLIVKLFEEAITPKTRLIMMSHMVNITGQIMPVRSVVEMARRRKEGGEGGGGGIPVIVDGAHALAHFEFKLGDLGCDYYGVSLHKWLAAPHGSGLLYVRREKIKGLWPLMAAEEKLADDIRKFEEIGTHPAANFLAIGEALTFHQTIGAKRKEDRLRFLRDRWALRLMDVGGEKVRLHTSLRPGFSCGIATVEIVGIDPVKLADHLWDKHKILTVGIVHDEFKGIRVTPSVYTMPEEIDRFCEAMEVVIRKGLPGLPG